MKKLIIIVALAGAGYLGWKYFNDLKQENALAWASATDPVE